jgi:hypothetical protein
MDQWTRNHGCEASQRNQKDPVESNQKCMSARRLSPSNSSALRSEREEEQSLTTINGTELNA